MTWSSRSARGWRNLKRSWPDCAATSAAAPTPALLMSSLRVTFRSSAMRLLSGLGLGGRELPERSAGEAGDELLEEEVVEDRERDARDQDRRHDRAPQDEIAADEVCRN